MFTVTGKSLSAKKKEKEVDMSIMAKKQGTCKYCRGIIRKGDIIQWDYRCGAWHDHCSANNKKAERERFLQEQGIVRRRKPSAQKRTTELITPSAINNAILGLEI